jgi:hypothetical protein
MGSQIVLCILLIAGAVVAVLLLRPRPRFVVVIREGASRVERGEVPPRFVAFCEETCAAQGIHRARISGFQTARGISLKFSKGIPERDRQKFRNVWNAEA